MAEGIFNQIITKNNKSPLYEIDSAGTSSLHQGELSDPRTRKNASSHGLNLTHRARLFSPSDFAQFDMIIVMDNNNLRKILAQKHLGAGKASIFKMRHYDRDLPDADVPDPWYGGEEGFEEVYQILKRCCQNLLETLQSKAEIDI